LHQKVEGIASALDFLLFLSATPYNRIWHHIEIYQEKMFVLIAARPLDDVE